jgi:hypothetical protein
VDLGIAIHVTPDLRQLAVQCMIRGVHFAIVHGDPQHAWVRAVEAQASIFRVGIRHERASLPEDRRSKPAAGLGSSIRSTRPIRGLAKPDAVYANVTSGRRLQPPEAGQDELCHKHQIAQLFVRRTPVANGADQ